MISETLETRRPAARAAAAPAAAKPASQALADLLPSVRTAGSTAEAFYSAFARRDGAAMQALYHPEVQFTDPIFNLHGVQAGDMWRMLTEKARDFRLEYEILSATHHHAKLRWQAWYEFSGTGRSVHNVVETQLEIRDGLILRHVDQFDFWRWSQQALGASGWMLGWTPWLQRQVHEQALAALEKWQEEQATEAMLDALPS